VKCSGMAKTGVVWGEVGVSETVSEVGPVREGGRKGGKMMGGLERLREGGRKGRR
jgi:hypothetical protein